MARGKRGVKRGNIGVAEADKEESVPEFSRPVQDRMVSRRCRVLSATAMIDTASEAQSLKGRRNQRNDG